MKPLRLRARNLRTFPDLDLPFDEGLIGILGELRDAPEGADSNGAGKSTILEAIDIALFGRRSLAGYLTRGGDVDELMIELTFDHADRVYRVRRTFSAKGRGKTSVDLEIALPDDAPHYDWRPLTRASAKETDELICQIIGLSQTTFRETSYLRQRARSFASADPADAKKLLMEAILGRDPVWPRLADHAKARRRANEQQLDRHRGEVERLTDQAGLGEQAKDALAAAERQVVTAQAAVSEAEERHGAATTRWQAARDQSAARATLEAELKTARAELGRLDQIEFAAAMAAEQVTTCHEELATLTTAAQTGTLEEREREISATLLEYRDAAASYEQAKRDHLALWQKREDLFARFNQTNEQAEKLGFEKAMLDTRPLDNGAVCDHCGQVLGFEAREARLKKYATDIATLTEQARLLEEQANAIVVPEAPVEPGRPVEAEQELVGVRSQLERARADTAQRARLEERLTQLQRDVEARPSLDTITAARDQVTRKERILDELEPVDLDTLTREGTEARAQLEQARTVHTDAVVTKTQWEERLATVTAAKEKLTEIEASTRELQTLIERDVLLEKAYGRDGIPALIIENTAIPSIEAEASRILRALGTGFDVELRTQAETKTGTLRDTLNVVVIDRNGNVAEFEDGTSGGEQTRVELALKIALAVYMAADSKMLALDEPSYLDKAGMEALVRVLHDVLDRRVFEQIFLVSHIAELRDSLDDTITVIQEGGVSRVAGDREPVEAVA